MNRVYILGAGASAGYENGECGIRPPLARTFFQAVGTLLNEQDGLDRNSFGEVWAFIAKYFRVSADGMSICDLDIEEVLTMIDIGQAGAKVRRQLLDLIVLTLDKVIYGIPCPYHQRLLCSLHSDDALITFNWDLLIDNICLGGPNYGINLLETIYETEGSGHAIRNRRLVLKPHGSMNWMSCQKCHRSFAHILGGKTAARYHAGQEVRCQHCSGLTEPLIIPPTLMKNYQHPVIRAVWVEAARVLCQAEEIVIVGYSLPPTDFKARWLFMEASAKRSAQLRSLIIVDKKPKPLKPKFQQVFHVGNEMVRTVTGGIKDIPYNISND
jgi:NAD-dependent SIR2 family protein deacetylase